MKQLQISFPDPARLPPPLGNLKDFRFNDSLNVISGANGSGKTRLLEELERYFSGTYGGNKIVRRVAREDYNQSFDPSKNPSPRASELKKLKVSYHNNSDLIKPEVHKLIADIILFKIMTSNRDLKKQDNDFIQKRLTERQMLFSDNASNYKFYKRIVQDILAKQPQYVLQVAAYYNQQKNMPIASFYKDILTSNERDFQEQMSETVNMLESELDHYALDILRVLAKQNTTREEMNGILSAYYNYEINPTAIGEEVTFTRKGQRDVIRTDDLSSGELALLKLLLWRYKYRADYTLEINTFEASEELLTKVGVLLLDEPDSHFDPKMSRVFFEVLRKEFHDTMVIMTTHRTDTIALANAGEIFILENKQNQPVVRSCSKLLALAKLTRNLQSYTGMHIKVYTESFDDAKFYEGTYANLMMHLDTIRQVRLPEAYTRLTQYNRREVTFCQTKPAAGPMDDKYIYVYRQNVRGKVSYFVITASLTDPIKIENNMSAEISTEIQQLCLGQVDPEALKRCAEYIKANFFPEIKQCKEVHVAYHFLSRLSRRYQMGFYSSSLESGSAGGVSQVVEALNRECNRFFMRPGQRNKQLPAPSFFSSYHSHVANLFRTAQVDHPFGIIDGDNKDESRTDVPANLKDRIVQTWRHSIENFIFDPVVICSTLSSTDIDNIANAELKKAFNILHQAIQTRQNDKIQTALFAYCNVIKRLFLECPVKLVGEDLKAFKDKIKKVASGDPKALAVLETLTYVPMGIIIYAFKNNQDMKTYAQELLSAVIKNPLPSACLGYLCEALNKNNYKVIDDFALPTVYRYFEEIFYEVNKNQPPMSPPIRIGLLLIDSSIIFLDYPEFIANLRGHNVEYIFESYLNSIAPGSTFKNYFMNTLCEQATYPQPGNIAIPLDLAKAILDLNARIKSQVIEKADNDKFKNGNIDELGRKGYFVKYIKERRDESKGREEKGVG